MEKKYELIDETIKVGRKTLHRIRALRDFGDVKKGDLGGFIENEDNLSHEGNCWVAGSHRPFDSGYVFGNAKVFGDARIFGDAEITGNTKISIMDPLLMEEE
ncbi:hypothetical protein [Bartonella mastomydis]|uniref:hypothetical protein n=1 Tax=Bartonella mastomydis TaxID=1820002 RepID=UPI001115D54F